MTLEFLKKRFIKFALATTMSVSLATIGVNAAAYSKKVNSATTSVNGVSFYTFQTATYYTTGATRWSFGICGIHWVSGSYLGFSHGSDSYGYSKVNTVQKASATTPIYVTNTNNVMQSGNSSRYWAFDTSSNSWVSY